MYHYMSPLTSIVLAATPSPAAQPSPSSTAGGLTLGTGVNPLFLVIAALAVLLLVVILVARLGGRRGRTTPDAPPAPAPFNPTDLDPAAATGEREIYKPNPTPYIGAAPVPAAAPTYEPAPAPAPAPMPLAPTPRPPEPPPPVTMPAAPPQLPQSSMPIDSPFAPEAPPELPSSPPPPPLSPWAGAVPADVPLEPPPPPPSPVRAPEAARPEPPAAPVQLEIPPAPQPLPPRSFAPSSLPAATDAPFLTPFVDPLPAPEAAVTPAPSVDVQQPEAVKPVAPGTPPVILIIEDDERIQKFYSILFSAKGYRVESASDGVEGVDMATSLLPDLILLDVMMPKMNGLMVLQTLRANPDTEATPVVVLSNYMEPPLIQRALQLGAIEYVVKSQARPEQLVNALPLWLEGKPALH